MPEIYTDWEGASNDLNKSSISYKRALIADLAASLMKNNLVMSGKKLQILFNKNGVLTQYEDSYSEDGGRGIHKLISQVWKYYYDNNDYQTAYNISRSFVNQNGEYAWM